MSEILWAAVPSGLVDPSTVLIRVLVVPRLQGSLDMNGMGDWPATLAGLTFEVRTDTSDGITLAAEYPSLRSGARLETWQEFFGGDGGLVDDWQPRQHPAPAVDQTHGDAQRIAHTYQSAADELAGRPDDAPVIVRDALRPWSEQPPAVAPAPPPPVPRPVAPDFHHTVAVLREHPAVLRELGLVFELTLDRGDLEVGDPDQPRYLCVRCTDPVLDLLVRAPWTAYELDGAHFRAAPAPNSSTGIRRGMLDLAGATLVAPSAEPTATPPPWAICTFEVDDVRGRLRDAAIGEVNPRADVGPPTLPHLRSAGLMLIRPGRAADYADRTNAASANLGSMEDARLTAEDLVLGYRVDIRAADGLWRSLTERVASYSINDQPIGVPATHEEGHIKAFSATRLHDDSLRTDEVVARWSGWSHAVPPVNLRGGAPGARRRQDAPLPYDFRWTFTTPSGRLPALRFGMSYQLRVRVADPTGGGLELDDGAETPHASEVVLYTRHEPVHPPRLTADADEFPPGAGIDRLVIRSDHDRTAADLTETDPRYPAVERRTLLPSPVTFAVAEQHGVFDGDTGDERTWGWARRALDGGGLPDPAAAGVHAYLRREGVPTSQTARTRWTPAWPDQQPKVVELGEQTDPATPVAMAWQGNKLNVQLGKGKQATIELSGTIGRDHANHFNVVEWLINSGQTFTEALNGRHPLLTPARIVHVVHAVRRPLVAPRWVLRPGALSRAEHDTTATITADFVEEGLDVDSTGQVDVGATWTEWTDAGSHEAVVEHLHSEPIALGNDNPRMPLRHEFGDTKHRDVTYNLTAISRYRQYFAAEEPDDAFRVSETQRRVNVPSSARPSPPPVLAVTPAFHWQTHEEPDRITHTRLGRRLRVEIAPPWYETGEGERLVVLTAPEGFTTELAGSVTQLARDPIWGTPPTTGFPRADWFAGSTGDVAQLVPPGYRWPTDLVAYPVHRGADRWYADVELETIGSYNPFVRLALARYQPDSLRGLELSTVVLSGMTQLLPDRTLVIRRVAGGVEVTLTGLQPNPPNRLEITLEQVDLLTAAVDLVSVDDDPIEGLPSWRPVAGSVNDDPTAMFVLPMAPAAGRRRVRVREIEHLDGVDDETVPRELRERSTFLDCVNIPEQW